MIGLFCGTVAIVYAISNWASSLSVDVNNPKKPVYKFDLTAQIEAIPLASGDKQSISPSIENKGNTKIYAFIKIDINMVDGTPVYTFTPAEGSNWTMVDTGVAEEIIYRYGEPTILKPGESAALSGTMEVTIDDATYADMPDDGLYYKVYGCGIGNDATSNNAADLYTEFVASGGLD